MLFHIIILSHLENYACTHTHTLIQVGTGWCTFQRPHLASLRMLPPVTPDRTLRPAEFSLGNWYIIMYRLNGLINPIHCVHTN